MPVLASQLILPAGYLDPEHFLPRVLATDLAAWIAEGEALVAALDASLRDRAVTAWAYYRARKLQVELLCGDAVKEKTGDESREYSQEQIDEFRTDRDYWLRQYELLSATPSSSSSSFAVTQRSNRAVACCTCGQPSCRHNQFR